MGGVPGVRVDHLGRASLAVILYYGRDILCGSPWVVILDPWGYSCAVPVVVAWGRGPRTGGRYKRGKNGPKKVDEILVGVALGVLYAIFGQNWGFFLCSVPSKL